MATIALHWQYAFILLPKHNYAPPTAADLHGAYRNGRWVEAAHDDLLFVRKTPLQNSRSPLSDFWHARLALHATRH
jgi:hypothetical protein